MAPTRPQPVGIGEVGVDADRFAAELTELVENPGPMVTLDRDWRYWALFLVMIGMGYRPSTSIEMPGDMGWDRKRRQAPERVKRVREAALTRCASPLILVFVGIGAVTVLQVVDQFVMADWARWLSGFALVFVLIGTSLAIFRARPAVKRWDGIVRAWGVMEHATTPTERLLRGMERWPGGSTLLTPATLVLAEHPDDDLLRRAATAVWADSVSQFYGWPAHPELEPALAKELDRHRAKLDNPPAVTPT